MADIKEDIYNQIIKEYQFTGSIIDIAEKLGISCTKVRRVLITEGLWSSRTSVEIGKLAKEGYSSGQIAARLHITIKNVQAYLPYTRGMYGHNLSGEAIRSRNYRNRIQQAGNAMDSRFVRNENKNQSDEETEVVFFAKQSNNHKVIADIQHKTVFQQVHSNNNTDGKEELLMNSKEQETENGNRNQLINIISSQKNNRIKTGLELLNEFKKEKEPAALHLHLELAGTNPADVWHNEAAKPDEDERWFNRINEEEKEILQKFGNMETSISRDVLIPEQMTWHALNYVILQLFGWQNSHLHNFELKKSDLHTVTKGGLFSEYAKLCGILFRFPDDDYDDQYWDDNYEYNMSFKTWMRGKYRGPYGKYGGKGELYFANQKEIEEFYQHCPLIDIHEPFEDYLKRTRNTIPPDEETDQDGAIHFKTEKEPIRIIKRIPPAEATLEELGRSIIFERDFNCLLERLKVTEVLLGKDEKKPAPDEWREAVQLTNYYLTNCKSKQAANLMPIVYPLTDEVLYAYDYGDGWLVRITCQNSFFSKGENFTDAKGNKADAALTEKLKYVTEKQLPLCIRKDGPNLVDDVGGISGFCEFLEIINSSDRALAREYRTWASGLGWTGRNVKPENML